MRKKNTITLGGREFKACTNSTLEHDAVVTTKLHEAGIRTIEKPADEDMAAFMEALVSRLVANGALLNLYACLIIPAELEGKHWTPAVAKAVEDHLKQLTDDEDKATVYRELVGMLILFFDKRLITLKITPSYSAVKTNP